MGWASPRRQVACDATVIVLAIAGSAIWVAANIVGNYVLK
jgi:hypothetical protein